MLDITHLNGFHMLIFTFDGRDQFTIADIDKGHIETPICPIVPAPGIQLQQLHFF